MNLMELIRTRRSFVSLLLYVTILVYFAHVGWSQYLEPVDYNSWFAPLNLCIHEGGHLVMRPFGIEIIHCAGGTALQLAAPLIAMFILLGQGEAFGIPFCLGWLSTNLINVGVYMADARARELPLVTAEGAGSSDAITQHDWAEMFTYFGLMDHDTTIGYWTRAAGSGVMILALVIGIWMLGVMLWPGGKYVRPGDIRHAAQEKKRGR